MLLDHASIFTIQFLLKFGGISRGSINISQYPTSVSALLVTHIPPIRSPWHSNSQPIGFDTILKKILQTIPTKTWGISRGNITFQCSFSTKPLLSIICVFHVIFKSYMEYMCFYHINDKYGTTFKKTYKKIERFQFASNCLEL